MNSSHTGQHRRPPANPYPPTTPPRMYPPAQEPFSPSPEADDRPGVYRWVLLGLAIGVVIAGPVGCSVGRLAGGLPVERSSAEISSPTPTRRITPIPVPSPTPSASSTRRPTKSDVRLEIEEKSRKCFGTFGCHVEYTLDAVVTDRDLFDPDTTYAITYKVQGVSQPILDTITMLDGRIPIVDELTVYAVSGRKLTAVVTKVKAE